MVFNKVINNPLEYLSNILFDGMSIMVGGFGLCGIPHALIDLLLRSNVGNITLITSNCGADNCGADLLVRNNRVGSLITAYSGGSSVCERESLKGEIVTFVSQGLLSERIRAAKAGIPAFYCKSGLNTELSQGKEIRKFNNMDYFLETALRADLALVKGWQGDVLGNLRYRKIACNFNQVMAGAASATIAEVDDLLEIGSINVDDIDTPNIYVDGIISSKAAVI